MITINLQHVCRIVTQIAQTYPRASGLYAAIILNLATARNFTLAQGDLGEAVGRGRDSSAVQAATERMADMGIVARDLGLNENGSGRQWIIRLINSGAPE